MHTNTHTFTLDELESCVRESVCVLDSQRTTLCSVCVYDSRPEPLQCACVCVIYTLC